MDAARAALAAVDDVAMTIAASRPRNSREASIEASYLLRHRGAFGDSRATHPAMFDAAIEYECARWGFFRAGSLAQSPASVH